MTDQDENKLIAQRRAKLAELRDNGGAFPNDFRRDAMAGELLAEYGEKSETGISNFGFRILDCGLIDAWRRAKRQRVKDLEFALCSMPHAPCSVKQ